MLYMTNCHHNDSKYKTKQNTSTSNTRKTSLPNPHNAATSDEERTNDDTRCGRFAEEDEAEDDGDDHTEFVNWCDTAYVTTLQSLEIEEPR